MNEDNIVIVTGQPGTGIKESLKKLKIHYISIEDMIEEIIKDSSRMQNILGNNQILIHDFKNFLNQIQDIQCRIWKEAFLSSLREIEQSFKKKEKIRVLTFHSIYYHQAKREKYSPVDFKLINNVLSNQNIKIEKVIVFIDDIYDVLRRLMQKGHMFDYLLDENSTSKKEAIFEAIFSLISLLHWREMEISLSRTIANLVGADFFVVATKHPSFMIKKLIEEPTDRLEIFYLSHPISEVRKISKKVLTDFVGKINLICKALISKGKIVFFPTSIDEKRIKVKTNSIEGKVYLEPNLDGRWDPPYKKRALSPKIKNKKEINPLNPQNFQLNEKENDYIEISRCLELLDKFIHERQIISRDYSLIEQCKDGIIAIRPFFNGVRSSGMIGEIKYNFLLKRNNENRQAYIFSQTNDMDKFKLTLLLQKFKEIDKIDDKKAEEIREKWIEEDFYIRMAKNDLIMQKIKEDITGEGFDFSLIQTINPKIKTKNKWEADHLGQKVKGEEIFLSGIRKELSNDDIGEMIKELENKEEIIYKFFKDDSFTIDVLGFIKEI